MKHFFINKYICDKEPLYNGVFSTLLKGYGVNKQSTLLVIKKINKNINKRYIRDELDIMKTITHKNVLSIIDSFYKKKKLHIVLTYCNGGNILQYIHSHDHSYDQKYITEILDGITYLYKQNIIHRDIKPQNILIHDHVIKICDFGLSKSMYLDSIKNSICGSPKYIAPELFLYNKYSRKSDIWSLGIILYEILFKSYPYKNMTAQEYTDFVFTNDAIKQKSNIYNVIENMLIVNESKRMNWSDLLDYTLVFESTNLSVTSSKPITIDVTSSYSRNRSSSICIQNVHTTSTSFNNNNALTKIYSTSAPTTFNLSHTLHKDYIDTRINQQQHPTLQSSISSNNLNYHDIIGESPERQTDSTFGYYYKKLFTSKK